MTIIVEVALAAVAVTITIEVVIEMQGSGVAEAIAKEITTKFDTSNTSLH